jgi:membrane associated rhomboid family serine protease
MNWSWSSTAASPPFETFFFMSVNDWPSCSSARSNTWRLVSYQFVHNGLQHLLGNSVYVLICGCICEVTHPLGTLAALGAMELGVVLGALTYAFVWPFDTLVGCSAGVYGLLGLLLAHVLINKDILPTALHFWLFIVLGVQALWDLFTYFVLYNSSIGYAAHCGGLFFGLFFGLSLGIFKPQEWKKLLAVVSIFIFAIMSFFLTYRFYNVWPPQMPVVNPTFHPYDGNSCCSNLYSLAQDASAKSLSRVRSEYYCMSDTDQLVPKNES